MQWGCDSVDRFVHRRTNPSHFRSGVARTALLIIHSNSSRSHCEVRTSLFHRGIGVTAQRLVPGLILTSDAMFFQRFSTNTPPLDAIKKANYLNCKANIVGCHLPAESALKKKSISGNLLSLQRSGIALESQVLLLRQGTSSKVQ